MCFVVLHHKGGKFHYVSYVMYSITKGRKFQLCKSGIVVLCHKRISVNSVSQILLKCVIKGSVSSQILLYCVIEGYLSTRRSDIVILCHKRISVKSGIVLCHERIGVNSVSQILLYCVIKGYLSTL